MILQQTPFVRVYPVLQELFVAAKGGREPLLREGEGLTDRDTGSTLLEGRADAEEDEEHDGQHRGEVIPAGLAPVFEEHGPAGATIAEENACQPGR